MADITDIADAVAAELNAGSFGQEFTAERHYRPVFDLPEMGTLHVTVVPQGMTIETAGRGRSQHDCRIDIAVQKKFENGDADELDPLMALVEQIADHFRFKRLEGLPDAVWVKTENAPIYAAEHMEQNRVFTSVLTLTFRVVR